MADDAVKTKEAFFSGGCFWCMQAPFERLPGVISTRSGYTGGTVANPTYEQVSDGTTGHRESIAVVYDPSKVSFEQILNVYWQQVDPTDGGGQFCDRGEQYTTAVFYHDEEEKRVAEESLRKLQAEPRFNGMKIVTPILPAGPFYDAEEYHQGYYKKNPIRYKYYRSRCGRDERLDAVWGEGRNAAAH